MYGDEYLYQQLGYKHIKEKLENVTEADIWRKAVHISKLPIQPITEQDMESYNQFKEDNHEEQKRRRYIFVTILTLALVLGWALFLIRVVTLAIQKGDLFLFFSFGTWTIVVVGIIIGMVVYEYRKRKTQVEKPIGIIYGYLVSSYMDKIVRKVTNYGVYVDYHPYLDIWFEEEDTFLRRAPLEVLSMPPRPFLYEGKEYLWSDLTYTPVKIYVFPEYRLEVMPAYAEFKE